MQGWLDSDGARGLRTPFMYDIRSVATSLDFLYAMGYCKLTIQDCKTLMFAFWDILHMCIISSPATAVAGDEVIKSNCALSVTHCGLHDMTCRRRREGAGAAAAAGGTGGGPHVRGGGPRHDTRLKKLVLGLKISPDT